MLGYVYWIRQGMSSTHFVSGRVNFPSDVIINNMWTQGQPMY